MVIEESQRLEADRAPVDLQSLSTRAYLDYTVVPILMDAMTAVAKERYRYKMLRNFYHFINGFL